VLWLAYVEDASHRDIAAAMGVREGSVRVLLFRAKQHLGTLLSKLRRTS
jgi:DNA-directed RNA polymerase specialized sigma24 family protein